MKIKLLSTVLAAAMPLLSWAQRSYSDFRPYTEVGGWVGLANYAGDVAENRLVIGETKVAYGLVVRHHLARHFALRAHVLRGNVGGSDQNSKDESLKARNFSFFTPITELGAAVEFALIDRDRMTGTGVLNRNLSPYAFVGGAVAFIHPTVECDQPGTNDCPTFPEPGQKRRRLGFPVGLGVRGDIAQQVSASAEFGWRPTFADDIDGVSLYGNQKANDWYVFFGGTLNFVFGGGPRGGF